VNVNNYLYVPSGKNWTLKIDIANNSITVFDSFLVTYHNSYIQDFCLDANDNIYLPLCNTDTLSAIYNASSQNAQFMPCCGMMNRKKKENFVN
jgi:hypothetical protein